MQFSKFVAQRRYYTTFVALLTLLFATMGCAEDLDDEEDTDLGGSLHTEPERAEIGQGDSCVQAGQYLGVEGAQAWIDCPLQGLEEMAAGGHTFSGEGDFSKNADQCAQYLELLIEATHQGDDLLLGWESLTDAEINAVLATGDGAVNIYHYQDSVSADEGLKPPECAGHKPCPMEELTVCVNPSLNILPPPPELRASIFRIQPTISETVEWKIDKRVSPDTWELFTGEMGISDYLVTVDVEEIERTFRASMSIPVENPTNLTAEIARVVIDVDFEEVAVLDECSGPEGLVQFPYLLRPGQVLFCSYTAEFPDDSDVAVGALFEVTPTSALGPAAASAPVSFAGVEPSARVVTVVDDLEGELGSCASDEVPCHFAYEEAFLCDDDQGEHINTATIEQTGQQAQAAVEVICEAEEPPKPKPPKTKEELKKKEEDKKKKEDKK